MARRIILFQAASFLMNLFTISVMGLECSERSVCPGVCCCKRRSKWEIEANCSFLQNRGRVPNGLPANVVDLDLSFTNISSLPANAFDHFPRLRSIKLVGNHLSSLDKDVFRGIGNLTTLNLTLNRFQRVPSEAFQKHIPKLQVLHLESNWLTDIPNNSFVGFPSLLWLSLASNRLTKIPVGALGHVPTLKVLYLNSNDINIVPNGAFVNNSDLTELHLEKIGLVNLGEDALMNLHSLVDLRLANNCITNIPTRALRHATSLQYLRLEHNAIPAVPRNAFVNNPYLTHINLNFNKINSIASDAFSRMSNLHILHFHENPIVTIGHTAFRNLPDLRILIISDVISLSVFPDLTGTFSLEDLTIERCSLTSLPEHFCLNMRSLSRLDLQNNQIESIPSLSKCVELKIAIFSFNKISSLEGALFSGLHNMYDLSLHDNQITHIPADAFEGLSNLNALYLGNNSIEEIDSQAFASVTRLEQLQLSGNLFPVLPSAGLQNLLKLHTSHNERLRDFPPPSELPSIGKIETSYAYHCCDYVQLLETTKYKPDIVEHISWGGDNDYPSDIGDYIFDSSSNPFVFHEMDMEINWNLTNGFGFPSSAVSWLNGTPAMSFNYSHNVSCKPMPGPLMPCADLFGSWPLRIGIWLVFLLASIGNMIVIFVILVSHTKMDVPRFLICNLAVADFFLGMYLGFLAGVDASTFGVFRKWGVSWHRSCACPAAGFLAVFSSELSIYTLSVITLERFYAIKHALHLEKRLKLPHAIVVMCLGWIFALGAAVLPLVNVSNYRKFPVCLPLDISTTIAKAYGGTLLIMNILAFVVIMFCYASIYMSIQGSHAWNCNDSRVARRMSLLVFTDFACWAPITFFSLTTMFGVQLISINGAKVLTIFVLPLNSCANPFLYTVLTKQFKKDCKTIMRTLSNRFSRQRSMSRSAVTLSLGHHPSTKNSQVHQTSQLRWRTDGSISQDVTSDPCLVCFKTENGEPSSNIYTVSRFSALAKPSVTESSNINGSCSHDNSHSDSSSMLDPSHITLDDPRRGSKSPLLDLLTHTKSRDPDAKPKSKNRRKFSIPIPFFSSHSPSKVGETSSQQAFVRASPQGQRHKRSHSVTEGLLYKMGRKKPLTSIKSAPGIAAATSSSSDCLQLSDNSKAPCVTIHPNGNPDKGSTEEVVEEPVISDVPDPWVRASSPKDQDGMEAQYLLEVEVSSSYPASSSREDLLDSNEAERLLQSSSHDNPIQDQLSSASLLLHRPQELSLAVVPPVSDNPDCDSGLGTASPPYSDPNDTLKLDGEDSCSEIKSQTSGLGSLLIHLTKTDQSKEYRGIPSSPTKETILNNPRESIV